MAKKIISVVLALVAVAEVFFGVKLFLSSRSAENTGEEVTSSEAESESTTLRGRKTSRKTGRQQEEEPSESFGEIDIEDDINPAGAFEKTEQSYCFAYVSTESSNLNVRAEADQNSAKIGSLSKGQVVLVNSPYGWGNGWEDEPTWVSIEYYDDGYTPIYGWVQNSYLTKCDKIQNFYYGEFGYENSFAGEGKDKARADEMMKIFSDFSESHRDIIHFGECRYIGMYRDYEGKMGYIYSDMDGLFPAEEEGIYDLIVYPSENEIRICFYEGATIATFKNNRIVRIAHQYDDVPVVYWEAQ